MNTRTNRIYKIANHASAKYISTFWLTELTLKYDFGLYSSMPVNYKFPIKFTTFAEDSPLVYFVFHLLVVYLMALSVFQIIKCRMVVLLIRSGTARMEKSGTVA